MRLPRRSSFTRSALAAGSVVAATSLLLSGCGSKATESDSANAASCVDTSGPTIKVGALNSLSGAMAISEVTVQHIGFALESSQRYYILESGRVTSSGTGGSASEADVRAAMAI